MHFDNAVKLISAERGKQFDPVIIDTFINNIDMIKSIYNQYSIK